MPNMNSRVKTSNLDRLLQRLNPNVPAGSSDDVLPRIPRDSDAVRNISAYLRADPRSKVLFSGHIGVGKSTELVELGRIMADERWVIECSVAKTLGVHNVSAFALLLLLLEAAVRSWVTKLEEMPPGLVEGLKGNIHSLLRGQGSTGPSSVGSSGQSDESLAHGLVPLSMLLASRTKLARRIRTGADILRLYTEMLLRTALRSVTPDNVAGLDLTPIASSCEVVLKELAEKAGKPVLVLIDDLDKVRDEAAKVDVFLQRAMAWQRLPCGMVATVPLDAVFSQLGREMEHIWFDVQVLDPMPVPRLDESTASERALQPYLEVLRSVGGHEVFSARQCRRLAIASSGLPRTFVAACAASVARAIEGEQEHVRDYHIDLVLRALADRWRGRLDDHDYEALVAVVDSGGANVPAALDLLRDGVLIRDSSAPPEQQFRVANWAEPLLDAYRARVAGKQPPRL